MGQVNYDPLYLRGVDEFNRENYFESHEVWEDLWIGESGSARQFYKGLIQAAVMPALRPKIELEPSPEEDHVGI